ncbi:MAG: hypothetical protein ACR2J5_06235 [Geodermatophilaceae bacterium]
MDIHGVGPVVAARVLADVGDVARLPDRNTHLVDLDQLRGSRPEQIRGAGAQKSPMSAGDLGALPER